MSSQCSQDLLNRPLLSIALAGGPRPAWIVEVICAFPPGGRLLIHATSHHKGVYSRLVPSAVRTMRNCFQRLESDE